ncbi:hypothetical protein GWO13_03225 [Candidatus Bathyarchaeota archaeon]|nr:hypothetical protein [Candidatus Bathyarchaeota archaeon]
MAEGPGESIKPVYLFLKLPGGEENIGYLLLQLKFVDSKIRGRAFYLSNVHHLIPSAELSMEEVGKRLSNKQGSCVPLHGTKEHDKVMLETSEIQYGGTRLGWRYKWKITGSLDREEPVWHIKEDYWSGVKPSYEYYPSELSLKAPLREEFPAELEHWQECGK